MQAWQFMEVGKPLSLNEVPEPQPEPEREVLPVAEADFPHREDPRLDLDKAGFGIVAVPDNGTTWKPKAAFVTVARSYRRLRR